MKNRLLLLFLFGMSKIGMHAQVPFGYYQFENPNNRMEDANTSIAGNNYLMWAPNTQQTGGPAGTYVKLSKFDFFDVQNNNFGQICLFNSFFGGSGNVTFPIRSEGLNPLTTSGAFNSSYMNDAADGFAFEYLFRAGTYFGTPVMVKMDGLFSISINQIGFEVVYVHDDRSTGAHTLGYKVLSFDGSDRKNYTYYTDGNWHHFAISYNEAADEIKVFVDGICPPGFSFPANVPAQNQIGFDGGVDNAYISRARGSSTAQTSYQTFDGDIDEIAVYNTFLKDEMALQHYLDIFPGKFPCIPKIVSDNPGHYSTNTSITADQVACSIASIDFFPTDPETDLGPEYPTNCTAETAITPLDWQEFVPNYTNLSAIESPLNQLKYFAAPRYVPETGIHPLVPWFAQMEITMNRYNGLGATGQEIFDINQELVKKYNFGVLLGHLAGNMNNQITKSTDPSSYEYKALEFAKNNPKYLRFMLSGFASLNNYDQSVIGNTIGSNTADKSKTPKKDYYVVNGSTGDAFLPFYDDFFDVPLAHRTYDPTEPAVPALMAEDGKSTAQWLDHYFNALQANSAIDISNNLSNRGNAIDLIGENMEVYLWSGSQKYLQDQSFNQAFTNNNPGNLSLVQFGAKQFVDNIILPFQHAFMQYPSLANKLGNARFAPYDFQGNPAYLGPYSETKRGLEYKGYSGSNRLAMSWYYPQRNYYWYQHGLSGTSSWTSIIKARRNELAEGDAYYSPAVSPGISHGDLGHVFTVADYQIMRPGTYLAMLKGLAVLGADHYFVFGYNINHKCAPNHVEWNIWQYVMPSYAQAVTSKYYSLFQNSTLLPGDANLITQDPATQYSFSTGTLNDLVVVREEKNQLGNPMGKYVVFGTTQYDIYPNSPATPAQKDVTINLTNAQGVHINKALRFEIRRQGSVYLYDTQPDLTTAAAAGVKPNVFYQLDKWHERTHPLRWTKNIEMEAEVFDDKRNGTQGDFFEIWTKVPSTVAQTSNGTPINGDYSSYESFVTIYEPNLSCYPDSTTAPKVSYAVQRSEHTDQNTLYLFVRARSKGGLTGVQAALHLNGIALQSNMISNVGSTNWKWYAIDITAGNQAIAYQNLSTDVHWLHLYALNSDIEIDQVVLSSNPNYQSVVNSANVCPNLASIASNPNPVCLGNGIQFNNQITPTCPIIPVQTVWNFGDGNQSNQTNPVHTYTQAGTYNIILTVSNATYACTSTATTSVTVSPAFTVNALEISNLCAGGLAVVEVSASGGQAPYTGVGTFSLPAGTHNFTVTDALGCTSNTSITIAPGSNLSVSIAPLALSGLNTCEPDAHLVIGYGNQNGVNLNGSVSGGTGPYTYTWTPASGLSSTTIPNPVFMPNLTSGCAFYTLDLSITDINGCSGSASITVKAVNVLGPQLGNSPRKVMICHRTHGVNQSVQIEVSQNAVPAHLAHGDCLGSCTPLCGLAFKNIQHDHNDFEHEEEAMRIYPNPNNGEFEIELLNWKDETAVVEIYDQLGKLIYTENPIQAAQHINLNLDYLSSGIYYVKVNLNQEVLGTSKIVIEK